LIGEINDHSSELSIIAWTSSSLGVETDSSYSLNKSESVSGDLVYSSLSSKNIVDLSESLLESCIRLIAFGSFSKKAFYAKANAFFVLLKSFAITVLDFPFWT